MDAALRPRESMRAEQKLACFNPCFNGCRPATVPAIQREGPGMKVSILVLMDAALRRHPVDAHRLLPVMFQSLF